MKNMTAQLTRPVEPTATVSVRQLRARKKQLNAELEKLTTQSSSLEESAPGAGASAGTFEREREICRELADVISSIRTRNARRAKSRKNQDVAVSIEAAVDTTACLDPFFDAPIEITSCVTNCDSDCVTNCTDGCTLACDSDCRTGCTSGCTFSQSGNNTGSYIVTPMITATGKTELRPVPASHFSIEWN